MMGGYTRKFAGCAPRAEGVRGAVMKSEAGRSFVGGAWTGSAAPLPWRFSPRFVRQESEKGARRLVFFKPAHRLVHLGTSVTFTSELPGNFRKQSVRLFVSGPAFMSSSSVRLDQNALRVQASGGRCRPLDDDHREHAAIRVPRCLAGHAAEAVAFPHRLFPEGGRVRLVERRPNGDVVRPPFRCQRIGGKTGNVRKNYPSVLVQFRLERDFSFIFIEL